MRNKAPTLRRATASDLSVLARLIDGFAKGHPAEGHKRSVERLREAFFGDHPVGHVLLAERDSRTLGFGAWRKTYDPYWSVFGGEGMGLYVIPSHRNSGVALCIVAAMCEEIRRVGGQFLQTTYDPALAPLYERVAVGRPERTCHLSARAFVAIAAAAGNSAREILRRLPDRSLNYAPIQR